MGNPPTRPPQRGLRPVVPGQNPGFASVECRSISPRVSEWLPELLERLLPCSAESVREAIVEDLGTEVLARRRPGLWPQEVLVEEHGVDALATSYADGLVKYSLQYYETDDAQLTERQTHIEEWLRHNLTELGSGRGMQNAGIDAVLDGPVAVHAALDERPLVIRLSPDPAPWTDADRDVLLRSLRALSVLAQGFHVQLRLPSPQLRRRLQRSFPAWYEAHIGDNDLTERGERSQSDAHADVSDDPAASDVPLDPDDLLELYVHHSEDGKHRLLAALASDEPRQVRALKRDPDVDAGESTVDAYLSALEADSLVEIERRSGAGKSNRVCLTDRGAAFAVACQVDGVPVHPEQTRLEPADGGDLTATPHRSPSTVYRAGQAREGGTTRPAEEVAAEAGDPAEAVIATTGDPEVHDEWVQWLKAPDGVAGRRDRYWMHKRYAAGRRTPGVSLVDDPVQPYDDGRVVKASCFDDELQLFTQWGRSLPTLGRIAGALMSPRVVSKALTPEATGDEFERLYDGALAALDEHLGDWIRYGPQIGWFSEDEEEWSGWRDRFGSVSSLLIKKVGELAPSDDVDRRKELYRDLHGFIASMTQLYYAVGIDVLLHIRVPDTKKLVEKDERYEDFLRFFRYTMPKQTVYPLDGAHSGYRMTLEKREQKLKMRMPYDVSAQVPAMHLTASMVVSGPTATEFRDDIETAIEREREELREAIQEGDEPVPEMRIPVVDGTSYAAIREVLREFVERKGYDLAEADSIAHRDGAHEERRLVRLLLSALSREDAPGRASPYSVAEAVLALRKTERIRDTLSTRDLAYGLSQLPARRLMPSLKPNQRKILKTLLASDEPLGRSEAVDRAGISGSRWHQHIKELAALDVVEPITKNGRKKWVAYIEPWWAPERDRGKPFEQNTSGIPTMGTLTPDAADLLFEIYCELDDIPILDESHELFGFPFDYGEILDQHPVFRRWWPFVLVHAVDLEALDDVPEFDPVVPPPSSPGTAQITPPPEAADQEQTTLDAWSAATAPGTIVATDGGKIRQTTADDGSR